MRSAILTYLLAVHAASTAANPMPADDGRSDMTARDHAAVVDKRACQTILTWSGGGCSAAWGFNRCKNRCLDAAGGKGCCSGTVTSSVLSNPGCFSGFKVCGCGCLKNP
ncbi:hypothetical protein BR93DRAFT_932559 [Coniochaeta sp. PMI_546]|nr:hypothetical protein BR93DRAFT_932559 [Coniochaeta sp. PMI_546]